MSPLRRPFAGLIALLLSFGLAATAAAQAYKYVDEHGSVHFTEDPGLIPEKYRDQIETRDMPVRVSNEAGEADTGSALGPNLFGQDAIDAELEAAIRWMYLPFFLLLVAASILSLGMVIHPLTQGEILWAVLNFFVGISIPIYIMVKLEQPAAVRVSLVALWASPFVLLVWAFVKGFQVAMANA